MDECATEVRFEELRRILRLVGDLRDLPPGSEAQRTHLLSGLCDLLGAQVALWLDVEGMDTGAPVLRDALDLGWSSESQRRTFRAYLDRQERSRDPSLAPIAAAAQGACTLTRQQVLDDRTWYRSEHVQEYRQAAGVDQFVFTARRRGDRAKVISLHRPWGDRAFSAREQRLLDVIHHEAGWLMAPPAPDPLAGLPPRLRQTLEALCEGRSEKQIAAELDLSVHTVHDYVKALHQRFGVQSRGELLARAMRAR